MTASLIRTGEFKVPQLRERFISIVALSWGLCAFFPVGLMYLHLLLMLAALGFAHDIQRRLRTLRQAAIVPALVAMVVWTLLVSGVSGWFPDTGTRIFHTVRVALVICMGLLLTPAEARAAIVGFLAGALVAAMIVAVHHVWGLPKWALWSSLLESRNNFSSGNMISMAIASGLWFFVGLRRHASSGEKGLALAAALALVVTVAIHSISRNAQLLLVVVMLASVFYGCRTLRASAAGAVAVLAVAAAAWQLSPGTQARFAEAANNLQATQSHSFGSSVGVRWRMYQEAAQGMLEHPVFGTGVGSWLPRWREAWTALDQAPELQLRFSEINNPHNDFLLAGMETGVLGMLLLVWLLARCVVAGWRQRSTAGGITFVLAIAISVTAVLNAPFRDAALGMTLLWLLGVSIAGHKALSNG